MTVTEHSLGWFLERFFGDGNDIRWRDISFGNQNKSAQVLQPFLREVRSDWERIILPRVRSGTLSWYALARNDRVARILREELVAFVGPSYADFRGQQPMLDSSDPVEAAVLDLAGRNVFRLEIVDPTQREICREVLIRLLKVRSRKPLGTRAVPRAPGRALRDFELAVQSRARAEAAGYLEELRAQGGASARNIRFLEVYLHEAFDEWDALYAMLDDGALVQAQRPTRVTRALVRAVYRRELNRFEAVGKAEDALAHFVEAVQPRYGRLYTSLAALDGPEVTKSFLLAAASVQPPRVDRRDVLLERYPQSAPDRPYVEALARLIPSPAVGEASGILLYDARAAFAHGDLDRALEMLLRLESSQTGLELLVRCAVEIGSIEAAVKAIAAVYRAPDDVRRECADKPRVQRAIDELRDRFAALNVPLSTGGELAESLPVPQSWLAWMSRLQSDPSWSGALAVAQQGALEWSVEEAARSPTDMRAFADALLSDLPASCSEALLDALPHLLEFFVRRSGSSRVFVPVQAALLDRLLYLETRSIESIRATGMLLDALMRGGMNPAECTRAVQDVQTAWREQPSVDLLDWALDVLDSLVTLQVVPVDVQMTFAAVLRGELVRWRDRLSSAQVALYQQLCREGGFPFEPEDFRSPRDGVAPTDDLTLLAQLISGRVVALYSLRPEALRRARDVLVSVAPDVTVRTFSDTVGNDALRTAARTADIFVIVTGAATHAATEFIEAHRPKEATTLRCHATGSAGLLRVLEIASQSKGQGMGA